MNKLISSKTLIVVFLIIVGFYSYSEFKKHQFNVAQMTGIDFVSIIVVAATFSVIMYLSYKTVKRNEKLFYFVTNQIANLNVDSEKNKSFTEIKANYKKLVVDEYSNVNIPSFIEHYMSSEKIFNNNTIPKELKIIQANTSTPILVGVLGTFIGLVMALSQLEIGSISESLNLQPILNGVGTAFYTSISGVLFSILVGVHLRHFNSDQVFIQYMLKIENLLYREGKNRSDEKVVNTLISVREEIVNMRHSFTEVSNFSKEFKNASVNLQAFNKDFSNNIAGMTSIFESTKDVMLLFNDRTAQFHEDFERLFAYFKNNETLHETLTARQLELNMHLQDNFAIIRDFQQQTVNHLQHIQSEFNETVQVHGSQLQTGTESLKNIASLIETELSKVVNTQNELLEAQARVSEASEKHIEKVEKATLAMQGVLENSNFSDLVEVSTMFTQSTNSVQNTLQQFVQTYENMQQNSKEHYDQLADITTKIEQLINEHSSNSLGQNKELENVVKLITNYQENLQQAVIRFLNNDFDYDKLRTILDSVRENMDIQNQFLLKQLNSLQTIPMYQQPPMQAPQQFVENNETMR